MIKTIWGLGDKQFRRTKLALSNIAQYVIQEWEKRLLTEVNPRWWGRMALSNGNINQVKTPYGIKIFYTSTNKEYDYMDVVENGRTAYDIKIGFSKSERRKRKKNGGWYMTVPFTTNRDSGGTSSIVNAKNNDINAVMKKIGEYKDDSGQFRGSYEYSQTKGTTGKGNAFKFPQKTRTGRITYSYAKFVTASDTSPGWIYPAIPAHKLGEKLEKEAAKLMTGQAFKQAVERDTEYYIKSSLRSMGVSK